jgi:hypothetical protein
MFIHLPFGYTEARIDPRRPRETPLAGALEVLRRVRARRP